MGEPAALILISNREHAAGPVGGICTITVFEGWIATPQKARGGAWARLSLSRSGWLLTIRPRFGTDNATSGAHHTWAERRAGTVILPRMPWSAGRVSGLPLARCRLLRLSFNRCSRWRIPAKGLRGSALGRTHPVDWWSGRSRSALFAAGRHAVFTGLAHGVLPGRPLTAPGRRQRATGFDQHGRQVIEAAV
jgi:hypothetical protein